MVCYLPVVPVRVIRLCVLLSLPLVNYRLPYALEPSVDAAVRRALARFGAVGTEGDLIVFPGKIIDPLWNETCMSRGCERLCGCAFAGKYSASEGLNSDQEKGGEMSHIIETRGWNGL